MSGVDSSSNKQTSFGERLLDKVLQQARWISGHFTLVTVFVLGAVQVYFIGYFSKISSFEAPPVDVHDLAISSVVILGALLLVFNLLQAFLPLKIFGTIGRYVSYALVLFGFSFSSVLTLRRTGWAPSSMEFQEATLWIAAIAFACLFLIVFQVAQRRAEQDIWKMGGLLMIVVLALLAIYGRYPFIRDLSISPSAVVKETHQEARVKIIRFLNSVVLAFDPEKCELLMISRSAIEQINFEQQVGAPNFSQFDCLNKAT